MKIIFAAPIDARRFALAIDMDNRIVGGVAYFTRLENEYGDSSLTAALNREGIKATRMDIVWEWSRSIDPVKFVEEQQWEAGQVIENVRIIENKSTKE